MDDVPGCLCSVNSHSPVVVICIEVQDGYMAIRSLAVVRFERTCSSQKGDRVGDGGPTKRERCRREGRKAIFIATVLSMSHNEESSHTIHSETGTEKVPVHK